ILLLLLPFSLVRSLTITLSRTAGTPKYFYEARSLIVCQAKCKNECKDDNSTLWKKLECNSCVQDCIRKENMIFEDGPQDRGLIRSVVVCCARLVTYSKIAAKILFDLENDPIIEEAFMVLEYRVLSDNDDLHEPIWTLSQIVRERVVNISDLKCGHLYQFRLTLITTRIIDRRTSLWISNRHLCRYSSV
ncbi:hypothetical protein COOONC_08182, partial [Cooperia oncophora]